MVRNRSALNQGRPFTHCRCWVPVARRIAPYLPEDAVVEQLEGDRARVTLGSWSWDGLAGVGAGLAVPIRVEGPEELVEAVADLADRLRTAGTRRPA